MADNLLALVSQFLNPAAIAKIAEGAATDHASVQKLVGAAVPALMASFANIASTPAGAKNLADAVSAQDPALLDTLKSSLGQENQIEMAVAGSKMLGSVLGSSSLGNLTAALGKFAGTDSETTDSVLGLVGPAVNGVLGQQDPGAWADGNAIAATFAAQKNNIMAAMPAGLGGILSAAGVAGGLAAGAGSLAGAAGNLAGAARAQVSQTAANVTAGAAAATAPVARPQVAAPAPADEGGIPAWGYIIGGLVVLAVVAWFLFGRGADKKVEVPAPAKAVATAPVAPATPAPAVPAPAAVTAALPSIDVAGLTKDATAALDGLKGQLAGITDAASATAALPKLADATAQIDKLSGLASKLPADAQKTLAGALGGAVTALTAQIDKVEALPGVEAIAKPALEAIKGKLSGMVKM